MSDYIDKLEALNDKKNSFNAGVQEGKEQGLERGIKQGTLQTKKDMVINFYNSGVSIDIISSASGLSKEEIKEIIKANKKILVLELCQYFTKSNCIFF